MGRWQEAEFCLKCTKTENDSHQRGKIMKNYAQVLTKFQYLLHKNDWPKILYVTPGMYWDIIIASESQITPDWHYDPTRVEDDGYPFFLIGPTMVRCTESPARKGLHITEFPKTSPEDRFVEEWDKNESVQPEFKEKIKEMVEDGDLRVETYPEGETDERNTSEETPETSVRTEEGLDPGGVLSESPLTPGVHGDEDLPETGSKDDSSG